MSQVRCRMTIFHRTGTHAHRGYQKRTAGRPPDMVRQWKSHTPCRAFSLDNPREDGATDLPRLLRQVAEEIERLHIDPMEVLDVTIEQERWRTARGGPRRCIGRPMFPLCPLKCRDPPLTPGCGGQHHRQLEHQRGARRRMAHRYGPVGRPRLPDDHIVADRRTGSHGGDGQSRASHRHLRAGES